MDNPPPSAANLAKLDKQRPLLLLLLVTHVNNDTRLQLLGEMFYDANEGGRVLLDPQQQPLDTTQPHHSWRQPDRQLSTSLATVATENLYLVRLVDDLRLDLLRLLDQRASTGLFNFDTRPNSNVQRLDSQGNIVGYLLGLSTSGDRLLRPTASNSGFLAAVPRPLDHLLEEESPSSDTLPRRQQDGLLPNPNLAGDVLAGLRNPWLAQTLPDDDQFAPTAVRDGQLVWLRTPSGRRVTLGGPAPKRELALLVQLLVYLLTEGTPQRRTLTGAGAKLVDFTGRGRVNMGDLQDVSDEGEIAELVDSRERR